MYGVPPISLAVARVDNLFWIEVCDGRHDLTWSDDGARTRRILDNLTTDWGIAERATGKCVWAFVRAR